MPVFFSSSSHQVKTKKFIQSHKNSSKSAPSIKDIFLNHATLCQHQHAYYKDHLTLFVEKCKKYHLKNLTMNIWLFSI